MGHGFNLPRFAAFYRAGDSPQLTAFYQELIARENEAERSFASPEFSGPRFALEMLVDVSSSPSGRAVAVHNRFEVPDVGGGQSVELQPGVQTTVLVTPSEVRTDDGLDALPVERKGCVSYDDVEEGRGPRLELFSAYGQEGCQFECYMHQVKADRSNNNAINRNAKTWNNFLRSSLSAAASLGTTRARSMPPPSPSAQAGGRGASGRRCGRRRTLGDADTASKVRRRNQTVPQKNNRFFSLL